MKMIILLNKIINRLRKKWRTKIFMSMAKCNSKDIIEIYGPVHMFADNVYVKSGLKLYPNVCFMGGGVIEIGENVAIGNDTIIYASKRGGVKIGNNVSIAAHSYIIDCDHKFDKGILINQQGVTSKEIRIEDDVWIADNCTVLKGSIIKKGAVIGAKSLVNGVIDEDGIAVGIPAKIIKYRQESEE